MKSEKLNLPLKSKYFKLKILEYKAWNKNLSDNKMNSKRLKTFFYKKTLNKLN